MYDQSSGAAAGLVGGDQPTWQNDEDWSNCKSCSAEFSLVKRKHHCRNCGFIFCGPCSSGRSMLPPTHGHNDPQRVCRPCKLDLEQHQDEYSRANSNAARENTIDLNGSSIRYMNLPFSNTLGSEIRKASYSLHNMFTSQWLEDGAVPAKLMRDCCGIAFLTIAKAGFMFAGKVGTGLVIGKLADGSWSAPSAIVTGGMSWGALIGASVTDYVIILRTPDAFKAFSGIGNVEAGVSANVTIGPVGRGAQGSMNVGDKGFAPALAWCHSRGLYAGLSLEGSLVATRSKVNFNFYGTKHTGMELLTGEVPQPRAAEPLYAALKEHCVSYAGDNTLDQAPAAPDAVRGMINPLRTSTANAGPNF